MKRILISSAWLNPQRSYDVATWKKRSNPFTVNAPITEHFGLRFLKANHPEITILEYPTGDQFINEASKGWDAIGISFYINETNDAVQMAEIARKYGVPEIWAGNYGAMTPAIQNRFDKVFIGWGELPLAEELGKSPAELIHPPMFMRIFFHGLQVQTWGVLFTSRGCNKSCTFCQTPRFYRKPYTLDLSTIDAVLKQYRAAGVSQIIILDENFGYFEDYTREIIELLDRYRLKWNPMTRVETLYKNYDLWKMYGMRGASIGLESLNQDSLDSARKGNDLTQSREILRWMKRDHLFIQTFYIIGFEQDSESSIRENIEELRHYHIDSPQIQILTPEPGTKLFTHIEQTYGMTTYDYSLYDTTHLVWNHPSIQARQMQKLQLWANDRLFTPMNSIRTSLKIVSQSFYAFDKGLKSVVSTPLWTGNINSFQVPHRELIKYGSRRGDHARLDLSDNAS